VFYTIPDFTRIRSTFPNIFLIEIHPLELISYQGSPFRGGGRDGYTSPAFLRGVAAAGFFRDGELDIADADITMATARDA
jgi:hypothetical protein